MLFRNGYHRLPVLVLRYVGSAYLGFFFHSLVSAVIPALTPCSCHPSNNPSVFSLAFKIEAPPARPARLSIYQ